MTHLPFAGVHEWLQAAIETAVSEGDILASQAEDDGVRASVWMSSFADVEENGEGGLFIETVLSPCVRQTPLGLWNA